MKKTKNAPAQTPSSHLSDSDPDAGLQWTMTADSTTNKDGASLLAASAMGLATFMHRGRPSATISASIDNTAGDLLTATAESFSRGNNETDQFGDIVI
eukprot:SAG31_NODE_17860_length_655_cov_1.235612_2_plen_97_part_01